MKVVSFLAHILPSFEANRITEALVNREREIDKHLVPQYDACIPVFGTKYRFKNPIIRKLDAYFIKNVKLKQVRNANSLLLIRATAENLQQTIPYYRGLAADNFAKIIAKDGLTYSKANVLRYTEALDFFVNYARVYLNVATAAERAALDSLTAPIEGIGPSDLEYLDKHSVAFAATMRVLAFKLEAAKRAEKETVDMVVPPTDEEEQEATQMVGFRRTDPLGFAELPFPLSLVLSIRLSWSNWQVDKYEEAKAQSKAIEYRMLLIREKIEHDGTDAALEKQLEFYESQLLVLRRKSEKFEEEHADD